MFAAETREFLPAQAASDVQTEQGPVPLPFVGRTVRQREYRFGLSLGSQLPVRVP